MAIRVPNSADMVTAAWISARIAPAPLPFRVPPTADTTPFLLLVPSATTTGLLTCQLHSAMETYRPGPIFSETLGSRCTTKTFAMCTFYSGVLAGLQRAPTPRLSRPSKARPHGARLCCLCLPRSAGTTCLIVWSSFTTVLPPAARKLALYRSVLQVCATHGCRRVASRSHNSAAKVSARRLR